MATRPSFERAAGSLAIAVGAIGLAYSVTFSIYVKKGYSWSGTWSSILLMVGGLLSIGVVAAIYQRLRVTDAGFALVALILGLLGATGGLLHGSYDLAAHLNPPGVALGLSPIDPRGVLVFGATGLALGVAGWLIVSGGAFRATAGRLALLDCVLLVVVYVGRLTILDPNASVLAVAALLAGGVVTPAFYVAIGTELRSATRPPRAE